MTKHELAKADITAPPRYGLVPASMAEAMKLAEMMAAARLVPVALQKSPADCLMVIQQAIRWDMDPFAVAQECSVISGKLMHSGKLVAAVVNARGNLSHRLSFEYRGSGDDRTITVRGQLQGEPKARVVEVILRNAKTQNSMWVKQPDQQLMYHGARVWARRHTPELMLGVYSPEEFDDDKTKMELEDIAERGDEVPAMLEHEYEEHADAARSAPGAAAAGAAAEPSPPTQAPAALSLEDMAREAARHGPDQLRMFFNKRTSAEKKLLRKIEADLVRLYPPLNYDGD